MNNYRTLNLILMLAPFVFSFAFGLDIYIPIIPQMTQIFETTPAMIHLTLSLFLLTTGLGQVFIGPLSDQFGRKATFYLASILFTIGSIGCALSPDIVCLICARIVCAMGACGMFVTSFAVIRDMFGGETGAKMFSFLNGAIGISPIFAPIIGGYLAIYLGWQSIFYFMTFIGILAFFITFKFIKETHPIENRVKIDGAIFKRYLKILTNRQLVIFSAISGLAEGVFFCFFSISPFIIIELLNIPSHEFGYYFAAFGSVIAFGGLGSGKVVEKIGVQATIKWGIALMCLGGFSMLAWYYFDSLSLQGFLVPMVVACTGAMFLVGASASAALEPFGEIAGTAAAAFGAIQFGIAAFAGSLLMLFPVTSTVLYGIAIVIMSSLSVFLYVMRDRSLAEEKLLSPGA